MEFPLVIAEAHPHAAVVYGQQVEVTPFVGVAYLHSRPATVLGYFYPGRRRHDMMRLDEPVRLVQAWRGLQIASQLTVFQARTLEACWKAAASDAGEDAPRYFDELVLLFGSRQMFDRVRSDALAATPSPEAFVGMVSAMLESDIEVDLAELTELVGRGVLPAHPIIDELQRRREQHEAFINQPVPAEHSLARLFQLMEIDDLADNLRAVPGGFEFDRIELDQLDAWIKRRTASPRAGFQPLSQVTEEPLVHELGDLLGLGAGARGYWEGRPSFTAPGGSVYYFAEAAFRDGQFRVVAHVHWTGGSVSTAEYGVYELRAIIWPGGLS